MSAGADSFNATGPSVVAFETTSVNPPNNQDFGVSVNGSNCGVYGQGMALPKDRRLAPRGTGVYGRGQFQGVYGVCGSIPDNEVPAFGSFLFEPHGIGVVGLTERLPNDREPNATLQKGPAILGASDLLLSHILLPVNTGGAREDVEEALNVQAGVEGVSKNGPAVVGISFDEHLKGTGRARVRPDIFDTLDHIKDPDPDPEAFPTPSAAILGLATAGVGVRGISRLDRGGVFESSTAFGQEPAATIVAQVRLVPIELDRLPTEPGGPTPIGEAGDLLAVTVVSDTTPTGEKVKLTSLWFCTQGSAKQGSANPRNASWTRIA